VVDVENGTIRQAGAVSDRTRKFLRLKNGLVAGIYSSLQAIGGIGPLVPEPDDKDVSIDDAIEYGKALNFNDNGDYENARTVLRQFAGHNVKFTYTQKTLTAVEKRISGYAERHQRMIGRMADGPMTYDNVVRVATGYFQGAEYSRCISYCRSARENIQASASGSNANFQELCDYYIVASFSGLQSWDSTVAQGERFLKKYPGSMYFKPVATIVKVAITEIEQEHARSGNPSPELTAMMQEASTASGEGTTLLHLKIANEWFSMKSWGSALEWYRKIDLFKLPEGIQPDLIGYQVFVCYYNLRNRSEAQAVLDTIRKAYPASQFIGPMRQMVDMIPQ
jgi:hypothetical protein